MGATALEIGLCAIPTAAGSAMLRQINSLLLTVVAPGRRRDDERSLARARDDPPAPPAPERVRARAASFLVELF